VRYILLEMPYSSYTPYSYSNYGTTSRPYAGSKTYSYEPSTSAYSSTASKSPYTSTKSSREVGYEPRSSTFDSSADRKKQIPTFLSGNTASLRKAFGPGGSTSDKLDTSSVGYRSNRKSPERSYGLRSSRLF